MGEAKRTQEAEKNEDSAVVVLAKIREMLAIPEEKTVLSYIEKDMVKMDDIIVGAWKAPEKQNCFLLSNILPLGELCYAISELHRKYTNVSNMVEVQRMQKGNDKKIITPDSPEGGGIITPDGT